MILATLIGYLLVLLVISRVVTRNNSNAAFFSGERRSPWWLVAVGMVGASVSGVSFVSVPGMTQTSAMSYLQMCLGFIPGYLLVAFVLLPIFYRLGSPTIYSYLSKQLGPRSYKTGAAFFLLSDMLGAAVRFFLVCSILQKFVFDGLGVSFYLTVPLLVAFIYLYTRRGGVRTLVFTDVLQTLCMVAALVLIIIKVAGAWDGMPFTDVVRQAWQSPMARIFVFDDAMSSQYFWKQFISGIFIVVVMTGLNQNMMQKNLTCRTLRDAQKDMTLCGFLFIPMNLLLLLLGVMLTQLASGNAQFIMHNPQMAGDNLLPAFAATGLLGPAVVVFFTIGIVAAAMSSADSSLTALATSFCVDVMERKDDERFRRRAHLAIACVFILLVFTLQLSASKSLIEVVYMLASYTYGPLLGLFALAIWRERFSSEPIKTRFDRNAPYAAICAPLLCLLISTLTERCCGYTFGYELLLLNAALTVIIGEIGGLRTKQD